MSTVPDDPNDFQGSIDTVWLSKTAYLVFVKVFGFVFLEFGAVRVKNRSHIVLQIILNLYISCYAWWILGYAFTFGANNSTNFISTTYYGGKDLLENNQFSI